MNPLAKIGRCFINFAQYLCDLARGASKFLGFSLLAVWYGFSLPIYFRSFWNQLIYLGFFSIPVISLTAIFSGAVLALQSYYGMSEMTAETSVPMIVVLSLTRELGPVLSGLILAGRAGAFITAELSTMRVTDQIDATYTLSINPVRYLVTPRIWATTIALPILVFVFDILGFMGGYLVSVYQLGFSDWQYIATSFEHLKTIDVISGLVKGIFFGFIIGSNSCYRGYFASGGARGVGLATTTAVVTSSMMILVSNYIITKWFV